MSDSHVVIASDSGVYCRGNSKYGQCGQLDFLTEFSKMSDLQFEIGKTGGRVYKDNLFWAKTGRFLGQPRILCDFCKNYKN